VSILVSLFNEATRLGGDLSTSVGTNGVNGEIGCIFSADAAPARRDGPIRHRLSILFAQVFAQAAEAEAAPGSCLHDVALLMLDTLSLLREVGMPICLL
jgi:hypothetical protein